MRRFFIDIPLIDREEIILPPTESKHAAKVLRMKAGEAMEIINGTGVIFTGEITLSDPKNVVVKKQSLTTVTPDAYHIHIAVAPTKNIDRLEWFIEKATELGIHEITPILCDNSERKVIKKERLEKILVAATKQSKRAHIPRLNDLISFKEFVQQNPNGLMAHCYDDEDKNTTISAVATQQPERWTKKNTPLLIGPEGDFSRAEVELAQDNNYQAITLGKTRLRTETAALFACMNLKIIFEK